MQQTVQHTKPTIFSIWVFAKNKILLSPTLKRQKSTEHSDGKTMQASQGRKAGGDGKEGSIDGMLRGRDGGGRCAEGDL